MRLDQMKGKDKEAVLMFDNGIPTKSNSKIVREEIGQRISVIEELTQTSFLWSIKKLKRFIDDAIPDEEGMPIKKQGVDALKLFMVSMRYIDNKKQDEKEAIDVQAVEIRQRVEEARSKQPNRILTYEEDNSHDT